MRPPSRVLPALLAISMLLTAPVSWAQVRLPALGEAASADFSVADERRLGEQIMRDIWRDPDFLDDPVLLAYVQHLWAPLVAGARRLGHIGPDVDAAFAWQIFLVRDRSVNAFALPGGHVGVHLGLVAMTATRDELASVLAHELTHVSQRHIARGVGSSSRQSLVGAAAMILAILAASRARNTDAAQAAIVGGQAAMMQGQLNFSRDVEREADRIGFSILNDAGYAPSGMALMFEKLEAANRINDFGGFPYLRSHPLTTERISEARARVLDGADAPSRDGSWHAVMRARARVLMDPAVESLRRWQGAVSSAADSPDESLANLYAAALASSRLNEHARAATLAEQALAQGRGATAPVRSVLTLLAAEVQLAGGQARQALARLDTDDGAAQRPQRLLRAQAALAAARESRSDDQGTLRQATESLQTWTAEHPDDALAWGLLAQCAEAAGLPLRAARAAAEARAVRGDLSGAIDLLRATQRRGQPGSSPDFIEYQVIDSRVRAWVAQLRQERLDRGLPPAS